jgi:hypothetical protein
MTKTQNFAFRRLRKHSGISSAAMEDNLPENFLGRSSAPLTRLHLDSGSWGTWPQFFSFKTYIRSSSKTPSSS